MENTPKSMKLIHHITITVFIEQEEDEKLRFEVTSERREKKTSDPLKFWANYLVSDLA